MPALRLILSFAALASSAIAQISAPDCQPGFQWTFNSQGQNACTVAAYLESVCNAGTFSVPPLDTEHHYTGPDGTDSSDASDLCKCNTVVYSLISACALCQNTIWIPWSTWSANCTGVSPDGTYPESIPSKTRVPHWAYLNVTQTDLWNNVTAFAAAQDSAVPESTGTGGPTTVNPSATQTSGASATDSVSAPNSSSASSPPSTSGGSKSHTGAIAGGVVGGVVGVALLAGLAAYLWRRRQRAAAMPPSAVYNQSETARQSQPMMSEPAFGSAQAPYGSGVTPKRFYDPEDPSTFPDAVPTPTVHTTNAASDGNGGYHPGQYRGLPEV